MKIKFVILCFLFCANQTFAQNRNMVWCFGDSAGIDFNSPGGPVPTFSMVNSRGSSVSISDTSGDLLFYSAYDTSVLISGSLPVKVYDKTHSVMANGDSIKGGGWYKELVIVPVPQSDSLFYLFNVGVTHDFGLFYSTIDISQNGGLGAVVQKNVQLQNFKCTDGLTAVKHGNGRDWWVLFRRWDTNNNVFYKYLITPNGISNVIIQNIGSSTGNGFTNMNFSPDGSKMIMINVAGLMEYYDFDRCNGILSSPNTIHQEPTSAPYGRLWGCEFSLLGNILYVTTVDFITHLFQYDLLASNIASSKDTLWTISSPLHAGGGMKRAPDNKIYISSWYTNGIFPYPYQDSVYNMYNMNLSVINQPDSLGSASDFQPFSFYLGGKRTYLGLPNNPDYDLGPLVGSPCDTLVGITEHQPTIINPHLNVFYHPEWQTAFINADKLTGNKGTLEIFDVDGKMVLKEDIQIVNGYYTRNFNMTGMAEGMYFVNIISSGQRLSGKLVKY